MVDVLSAVFKGTLYLAIHEKFSSRLFHSDRALLSLRRSESDGQKFAGIAMPLVGIRFVTLRYFDGIFLL